MSPNITMPPHTTLSNIVTSVMSLLLMMTTMTSCHTITQPQYNVLFLASDDMRPELGVFSGSDAPTPVHPKMHTPNLDKLAGKSLLLKQAFVQQAVCNPSRTSLLTGRRPDTTHVYDLVHYFRKVGGNYTTIPQYFKEHGYYAAGMGKIFHIGRKASGKDDPISWSKKFYHAPEYYGGSPTWYMVDKAEEKAKPLRDQLTTAHAKQELRSIAAGNVTQPFFLAVGFHRPHLPWVAPKRFYDLYPPESISLPDNQYIPHNFSDIAWSNYDELRTYHDIGNKYGRGGVNESLPDELMLALRRGYYASVSYVDSLVGELLDLLKELKLSDNTIVSFWGDHGWQLGEHNEWCKHTNFELSTRAPMMIHVPGLTDHGIASSELTEFVDLFPTLVEAAGLPPVPQCPPGHNSTKVTTCHEGASMMPLIRGDPDVRWKDAVFSQYPRMAADGNVYMGYTMRTKQYRYTEWAAFDYGPEYGPQPDWDIFHIKSHNGVELYDHNTDPQENYNLAFSDQHKNIRKQLSKKLRAGWYHARPTYTTNTPKQFVPYSEASMHQGIKL